MKYLAAYALLSLSGNKNISAADIKTVLGASNCNVSEADLNRLIESLKGKDINKLIASGLTKIGSAGSAAGSSKAADSKPAAKQTKKQQPKKQAPKKKEQPKQEEEEDFGLGGGLFD